jgi:hypothetical protein
VTEPGDEPDDLLDADALFRGLNGFDQIAIEQHFRTKLKTFAEDGFALMRPLLFIVEKRAGLADADAFRKVMLLPLEDVTGRFRRPDDADDEDPSLREEQDRQYAEFVVEVGMSFLPDQYRALTLGERAALREAAAAARKARGY